MGRMRTRKCSKRICLCGTHGPFGSKSCNRVTNLLSIPMRPTRFLHSAQCKNFGSCGITCRSQVNYWSRNVSCENNQPEWEDKMNATGGHFQFQLKPNVGGGQIDE